jgi:hypothetical protein
VLAVDLFPGDDKRAALYFRILELGASATNASQNRVIDLNLSNHGQVVLHRS